MNTKNKLFSVLLITTIVSVLSSQTASAQKARAGFKGGLNVTNLYIDDVNDENSRLGFNAGLYGQVFSSDVFALQPELLYSTKGSKNQYGGSLFNQEVKYNLNYLDLPVLAVFKLGKSAEIHVGPYVSYLLHANIAYSGDISNGTDEIDKDNLNSFDYGLSGGFGLNFGDFQVGARYNYGLQKIANSDSARRALGDAKNSCAQLYVAFNLNAED